MRHFVHGADGNKYGPADLQTLIEWKGQNRITPSTMLEPEVGGVPFAAKDLPGLYPELEQRQTYGQADWNYQNQPFQNYPRPGQTDQQLKNLATATYVLGALSFICCVFCGLASIATGVSAYQKGHPNGKSLIGFGIFCTVASMVLNIVLYSIFGNAFKNLGL